MLKLTISITLLPYLFLGVLSQQESNCYLPTGNLGWCTPLKECHHFVDILRNLQKPLPNDVGLLLRESFFCDQKGSQIFVCCSGDKNGTQKSLVGEERNSCGYQNSVDADCIPYDKCSPFIQLMANLRKPLPKSTPSLVRTSYLCGQDKQRNVPKICCPSAALIKEEPAPTTTPPPETTTPQPAKLLDKFSDHPARSALEDSKTCGTPLQSIRIVGGQNAKIGQYPWLANLGYSQNGGSEAVFKCGGSLVGKKYVLTAAHCVIQLPRGFELSKIRVGEWDLSKDSDCEDQFCSDAPQDYNIESVIPHPDYGKPNPFQNDIAVIKLASEVKINDYVSPVCLPYTHDKEDYITTRAALPDGSPFPHKVEVAGWGATTKFGREPADILQYLRVNVTDFETCKETYAKRGGILNEKQICAGGEKGKDSCVGDSGSALMRTQPSDRGFDKFALIGIVSFGPRLCGTENVPGVYTRVQSYMDWILDSVQKMES